MVERTHEGIRCRPRRTTAAHDSALSLLNDNFGPGHGTFKKPLCLIEKCEHALRDATNGAHDGGHGLNVRTLVEHDA